MPYEGEIILSKINLITEDKLSEENKAILKGLEKAKEEWFKEKHKQ